MSDVQLQIIQNLRIENAKLKAENNQLFDVNSQTWCAYCGAKYARTLDSLAQIREHIAVCELHPMRKLEAENERMKEALVKLRDWAKAYPVEVFPEPDLKGVRAALELHGFTIDQVSASNFRWLLSRVTDTVDKALKGSDA